MKIPFQSFSWISLDSRVIYLSKIPRNNLSFNETRHQPINPSLTTVLFPNNMNLETTFPASKMEKKKKREWCSLSSQNNQTSSHDASLPKCGKMEKRDAWFFSRKDLFFLSNQTSASIITIIGTIHNPVQHRQCSDASLICKNYIF